MGAIGFLLAGLVILFLAIFFGWAFLAVAVGLAVVIALLIGIVFIALIVAAAIGLIRIIAG
jgi:hypothetical protein